jgi:CRP/FNR family cyclic AMP-dependent transcriptional regulator
VNADHTAVRTGVRVLRHRRTWTLRMRRLTALGAPSYPCDTRTGMTMLNIFRNARDLVTFAPGEVVFKEGDPGDVMYAVVDGRVDIVRDGATIETVGAGGIFGELALVDDSARGATAVAASEAKLARVDKAHFTFLVQEHPTFALQVMAVMAERLRRANERS